MFHFEKSGTGKEILVLFHGFGQNHSHFTPLTRQLAGDHFTTYAIDIYYHGSSHRPEKHLEKAEWAREFGEFLANERISSCSIIGFSLGARFAIASAILFPSVVKILYFIAPDGIFQSMWYRIANTRWGNYLFLYLVNHPQRFIRFLTICRQSGMVSRHQADFALRQLENPDNMKRVYLVWTHFRPLQYPPAQIRKHLGADHIRIHVLLSYEDHIIPPKKVLSKLLGMNNLNIHYLPGKHHRLLNASNELLISLIRP